MSIKQNEFRDPQVARIAEGLTVVLRDLIKQAKEAPNDDELSVLLDGVVYPLAGEIYDAVDAGARYGYAIASLEQSSQGRALQ